MRFGVQATLAAAVALTIALAPASAAAQASGTPEEIRSNDEVRAAYDAETGEDIGGTEGFDEEVSLTLTYDDDLIPEGVDEAAVRSALLNEYNLEVGAGLGAMAGKIWRIGLMGYASNPTNVLFCLGALDAVLTGMRAPIKSGVAVDAARRALTEAA